MCPMGAPFRIYRKQIQIHESNTQSWMDRQNPWTAKYKSKHERHLEKGST